MNRLFRSTNPTASDYAGLALFAAVYLAALTFVVAPETFIAQPAPHSSTLASD
ncbi:hypothetical protein [Pseudorhodobacter sp. MZDSW-24AT]|uniref:hypothetical protein n=1 Tax=Pseudorhodobacter sp. MZDSW-24AT TaxID=2052957 RepID=UPI0012FD70B3|nr:hypothetical protein [Pseudorhodobacter sp. MZDSW-24AT]